jgi:carboxylesterase type B
MIFFHGGSFEEGGSSLFFYNATNLAITQCVAVVTGNYRLGAFGSLFLPVCRLAPAALPRRFDNNLSAHSSSGPRRQPKPP